MTVAAALYPIEWGILFSPSRQGKENRYPSIETIRRIVAKVPDGLSAHLCGGYSRDLLRDWKLPYLDPLIEQCFGRVQVNTSDARVQYQTASLRRWADGLCVDPIVQCRDFFPVDENVQWLFDASGGRGISPKAWPSDYASDGHMLRGYAGGLGPDNVLGSISDISMKSANYWVDMESRIRDNNDRFDLSRCRTVCEAVYGKRD